MAICGCGLPAGCCQPAVAGGVIYADLRVSLALTWPCRLCLLRVLLCATSTLTSFPLSKHTGGGDTAPAVSVTRVYLHFTWEMGLLPSLVEFSSHCHLYKLSCCWLLGGAAGPAFSSGLVNLLFHGGLSFPTLRAQCALPSLLLSFLLLFIIQFLFYPWVWSVCPGGCADLAQDFLWEYHTLLSSPCGPRLPKWSGHWHLVAREPSWSLFLTWSGNAMHRLGVWRSQSFASSWWFFL
jgi:hypothetical protein